MSFVGTFINLYSPMNFKCFSKMIVLQCLGSESFGSAKVYFSGSGSAIVKLLVSGSATVKLVSGSASVKLPGSGSATV